MRLNGQIGRNGLGQKVPLAARESSMGWKRLKRSIFDKFLGNNKESQYSKVSLVGRVSRISEVVSHEENFTVF